MIAIMWQTWLTVLWNCLLVLPFAGYAMAATGQQNCYSTLDCNFESNSLCSWINVQSNDDFDWTLHKLATPSDNTGPNADHTYGNSQGTYIYIESSAPRVSDQNATLQSQVVKPHGRGSVTLNFWYNMYGNSIGQLSVYVLPTTAMTSFPGIRVWSLSGDQGKAWHHANITFDNTGEFHVLIEGTVGNGYLGDIAIDDLTFSGNCIDPTHSITRTTSTTTAFPPQYALNCSVCRNAPDLGQCSWTLCDLRVEECYTEQVLTSHDIMYMAGCRPLQQCQGTAALIGKRQTKDNVICSRCCRSDDCNSRLCGIRPHVNPHSCLACSSISTALQGDVVDPARCTTYGVCDYNEACFAGNVYQAYSPLKHRYGCEHREMCKLLMTRVFAHMDSCQGHEGEEGCRLVPESACQVCCTDDGCNYGSCQEIRENLYRLYKHGRFDFDTLKIVNPK